MTFTKSKYAPALASALLGIVVFAVTIGGTYVFDDPDIILKDPRIQSPGQWTALWTRPYSHNADRLYRPLVSTTYAIQWRLHGDRPWAFHLVNVLLHAMVCGLVAELTRRLIGLRAAFLAGLLFAIHPIHVEAIAEIVGRAELMCALGTIGALVLLVKPITTGRACAIAGCFLLAVLSKEQGMLLPLLLLALWPARRRIFREQDNQHGVKMLVLLLCWGLAGYIVWREEMIGFNWDRGFLDWTLNPLVANKWHPWGGSMGRDRWLMPVALLGRYAAMLVAPLKLSSDYGSLVIGWNVHFDDPYFWLGVTALLVWCAIVTIAIYRRDFVTLFATVALALTYGMISNFPAIIGVNFAERLMYLPSAFFLILIGLAAAHIPGKLLLPLVAIAIVLGSVRSVTYARRWNNAIGFYEISLKEQPKSIRFYMLLAIELQNSGRLDEAARVAAAGRDLLPEYDQIWLESGWIAMDQGKFDEAQTDFDKAMKIHPTTNVQAFYSELSQRRSAATTKP